MEPTGSRRCALGGQNARGFQSVHTCKPPQPGPQTPSSDFWKELQLALPRKVHYRPVEGDPQTQLQDDKDPMLILRGRVPEGRALDSEVDPDPEGDLGMPAQPHSPTGEAQHRAEWGEAQGRGPGGGPRW